MRPILVNPPSDLPVTLEEAQAAARIDEAAADVMPLIEAAVQLLDGHRGLLGRAMVEQKWAETFPAWRSRITLSMPDVSSVKVTYRAPDGETYLLPEADIEVLEEYGGSRIWIDGTLPALANRRAPVRIDYTAGYGPPDSVPAPLKRAILMLVTHWYDNRSASAPSSATNDLPWGVHALIAPYRWWVI